MQSSSLPGITSKTREFGVTNEHLFFLCFLFLKGLSVNILLHCSAKGDVKHKNLIKVKTKLAFLFAVKSLHLSSLRQGKLIHKPQVILAPTERLETKQKNCRPAWRTPSITSLFSSSTHSIRGQEGAVSHIEINERNKKCIQLHKILFIIH